MTIGSISERQYRDCSADCEQYETEGKITVTRTVALSKGRRFLVTFLYVSKPARQVGAFENRSHIILLLRAMRGYNVTVTILFYSPVCSMHTPATIATLRGRNESQRVNKFSPLCLDSYCCILERHRLDSY